MLGQPKAMAVTSRLMAELSISQSPVSRGLTLNPKPSLDPNRPVLIMANMLGHVLTTMNCPMRWTPADESNPGHSRNGMNKWKNGMNKWKIAENIHSQVGHDDQMIKLHICQIRLLTINHSGQVRIKILTNFTREFTKDKCLIFDEMRGPLPWWHSKTWRSLTQLNIEASWNLCNLRTTIWRTNVSPCSLLVRASCEVNHKFQPVHQAMFWQMQSQCLWQQDVLMWLTHPLYW